MAEPKRKKKGPFSPKIDGAGCSGLSRDGVPGYSDDAMNFPSLFSTAVLALMPLAAAAPSLQERPYLLIPEPQRVAVESGSCSAAKILGKKLEPSLGDEGYRLKLTPGGVSIAAGGRAGLFYAQQTLDQLRAQYRGKKIPCGTIEDKPRFGWRSIMIDSARHFIPVEDVKKFIDVMAAYKFNKLHMHLTDDQGWRIPVPGYPKLESIASKRSETFGDGKPHGGMYTKAQLKELVKYAAARQIEIIPEIDIPGHNQALCAAYPEFLCFPDKNLKVRTTAGISHTLICPGNPDVWKFYAALFRELKDIFPSSYVHLGGDEAPVDNWAKCPKCAKLRREMKIEESDAMKAAHKQNVEVFLRLGEMLANIGKKPVFWYEASLGKYPDGSMATVWRGEGPRRVWTTSGEQTDVICAPHTKCYFDYPQLPGDWPSGQPDTGWMPVNTLENAYSLDPGAGLGEEELKRVRGVECCHWSERIPNLERLFYQAYPRALAIAEAGWSPMEARDLGRFLKKVEFHKKYLKDKWGIDAERPGKAR